MRNAFPQAAVKQMTIDLPQPLDALYVTQALAAVLYSTGAISEKEARLMIGATRREFEETILPKSGLTVIGGTPEDQALELQACQRE